MNKRLRSLIDRAERLIAEREEANEGLRDLRKEMKSDGYEAAQIMKLAQLSYDDKKRAKLATANETLALYNRESGLGLCLGLDESDRAGSDDGAPEGGPDRAKPVSPDPMPPSTAGSAPPHSAGNDAPVPSTALSPAVETPSPAGVEPQLADTSGCPAAPKPSPAGGVPAGEPDHDWEKRDSEATFRLGRLIKGGKEPKPADANVIPDFLRIGSPENNALRGKA